MLPRIEVLCMNVDTNRYGDGNTPFSEQEIPLRKIDGLAHLNFDRLYPIDTQCAYAHLNTMYSIMTSNGHHISRYDQVNSCVKHFEYRVDGELLDRVGNPSFEEVM